MEQLSGIDSYWLDAERGNVCHHVAALGIYDPSTAPGGKVRFKDLLRHFERQAQRQPLFRKRLVGVPHGLDRPYWIDDPDPDIEFHVRHIALPQPGDWRQLMIQVARIHARPLDRSRPLWEVYVIEGLDRIPGLPEGSFALFLKFHHAAIDGESGAALLRAIHALTPDADDLEPAPATLYAEREPTSVELYSRAAAHALARTACLASVAVSGAARAAAAVANLVSGGADGRAESPPLFQRAPATRFNASVSANRVVDAVALPLEALARVRDRLEGTTVNDLFLAIVGGALRRYLDSKGELPSRSLVALMPVSVRGANSAPGNQVDGAAVPLHTDVADPVERVRAVRRDAALAKRSLATFARGLALPLAEALPGFALAALARNLVCPQLNVVVSGIRGPEATLYVAGARLVHFYPVSIVVDGVGLNHTGFSYNGVLWISAVACRNMLPDPAFYAQCLRESFDALVAAVDAMPARPRGRAQAPKRDRRRKRTRAAEGAAA